VKLLPRPLIEYLEELSRNASRLIVKSLPGTASNVPSSYNQQKYCDYKEKQKTEIS